METCVYQKCVLSPPQFRHAVTDYCVNYMAVNHSRTSGGVFFIFRSACYSCNY